MDTNKTLAKKLFLSLFAGLMPLLASAQVWAGGVWYNLNEEDQTAVVTRNPNNVTKYKGDIVVPATIKYGAVQYVVTGLQSQIFQDCDELVSVTLQLEGLASIEESTFKGCSSLTSITLPESVMSIGDNAFRGCSSLTSITLPESVMSIGEGAFFGCSSLTSITIPDGVASIGYAAFYDCSSLTVIVLPGGVASIGDNAFRGCSSLTSITLPEGLTSIGGEAFYDCSSLTSITIPEGLTSIGYKAFWYCYRLTSITLPEGLTSLGDGAFEGCASLTSITIPEGVTSIGTYAFAYCYHLTSITIPEGMISIGTYAFQDCSSLTSINIPENVTSIGDYAFASCSSLTAINIPENSQLTSIGDYAFKGCRSLTSITIPEAVTSIGEDAFQDCNINRVTFYCPRVEDWFSWNTTLKEVVFSEGVTSIGNYAFYYCSSLTTITIPEGSQLTSIGNDAFHSCSSLTSITLPEGVTSIGSWAFSGCRSLTSITLPEGVTSIGEDAFYGCSSLTTITLPEGVTSIGNSAFYNCSSLTAIYCYAKDIPQTGNYVFGNYSATLYVPKESLETYKSTSPWSGFSQILPVGEVSFVSLNKTSATITEGESITLTATVSPENASDKTVTWSSSNAAVATVDNSGKVTAKAPGTTTITAKAGSKEATCVVTVTKKEEPLPSVPDGEYYLYHAESKQFLSRGEHWGTCATVDRYGIPFVWTAEEYSLKFLDSNVCLFETDDNIYTDNNSTGFAFEEVEGGYLLKSKKSDRYLTIVDAAFTHQIVDVTDDASATVVWQLKSKAEHDAIVAGYVEENYANVIAASGAATTASGFTDYLSALTATDMTSAIGTARFAGSAGDWTFSEVRNERNQPAYGTDFCELWQATGSYTQTITGLAEGIYKVTVQGFERSGGWATCNTLAEKGYEITTATLSANGEEVNLKSWYSGKSDENNPNDTAQAVEKFNQGLYQNEVYTYVGKDGMLTLKLCKPSHVGGNWVLFNNFTLTRYAEVPDGEYYLYHAESKQFLSRGEHWGTCATVDRYGIPFVWTAKEYSLKFLDSNVCLFETDDNIYTDNNSTGFAFEEVEGGYLLKSKKSDRYLTIVDAAFLHQIVDVTDDASAATLWQLKSKAEHDAIVAGYVEENYANVIAASGAATTASGFTDYLSALTATDMTSAIGTARFAGSAGDWTFSEVRYERNQPAYGADFCELWQATGSYTQTITGLAEGIYKVTVQGFERSGGWATCNTLAEKGYEISTATLSANGEEVNLKSWYSGKSDENNPNNTAQAVEKFNQGLYQNEIYTYVGKDGMLTLKLCKPSHVDDNWVLFNNFTLTRYTVAVSGITLSQATATLTEGESFTLTATVTPDNATDKTVTWSSSNAAVATVNNSGKVTAVAAGTATITAKAGGKTATCVVTVKKKAAEIVYAEITKGDYYLKNVGSGKFLTGANDWGTQASLGEYGISITLERLPNGKYTLDTHVETFAAQHYLGSNGYIDAEVTEWIITEPKSGTYALTLDGTSYWGYDGSTTVLSGTLTDPTQKKAQWQLVTRAELENALSKATLNNGVDATFLIQGHSFSRNHNENAAWMGEPVLGGPAHDRNAEKFNTTPMDIYQELTGLPNGYYVVEVQGFYRDNVDPMVTAERRAVGSEQLRANLYAGANNEPLKSILDGATAEQLNGGIQTSYGWVPNNMNETATYFAQGLYANKVDAWVTDGTLRIGIRKDTGEEGDWVIFDNFRLTYYGTKAPAGIEQLTIGNGQLTIYDLMGRKVTDTENLKGGIYIVNGQKIFIK